MVTADRADDNPLRTTGADGRLSRRELTADQLRGLLSVTVGRSSRFRGLSGIDRHALYLTRLLVAQWLDGLVSSRGNS